MPEVTDLGLFNGGNVLKTELHPSPSHELGLVYHFSIQTCLNPVVPLSGTLCD